MNIAITGGGTGGHLSIAKSIKEELNRRDIKPIFIGSTYGQDKEWFKDDEDFSEKYFFETSGVVNQKYLGKFIALFKILNATFKCRNIFKTHKIDAVFSVGGYSSAPASFASVIFSKKLFIHEQNAVLGKLNRLLLNKSEVIFSSYLDNSPVCDYPVREVFFKNARVRDKIKTIIFLGGSQGATAINEYAIKIAPVLKEKNIKIIHQCGKRDEKRLGKFYKNEKIDCDLFAFSSSLPKKIKEADFAICRAGAGTLWELCASKLPALYIPYPYAASNHQFFNAEYLAKKGLSFVVNQKDLNSYDLNKMFDCDIKMLSMGLGELISPSSAKSIVDYVLKLEV